MKLLVAIEILVAVIAAIAFASIAPPVFADAEPRTASATAVVSSSENG